MTPDELLRWFPVFVRYLGLVGIVVMFGVWIVASRIEPGLLAMFGSLVGIGTGADALLALGKHPERKEPPSSPGSQRTG